jgi:tetratricopeptide (TPR) repeat protein
MMEIAEQQIQPDWLGGDNSGARSPTSLTDIEEIEKKFVKMKIVAGGERDGSVPKSPATRPRFACSLPTLDETCEVVSFHAKNVHSSGYISDSSSKKSKRSVRGKTNRLKKVQELCADATNLAHTGEEEEALKAYENAILIAGSEIARINFKIRKSRGQHEATRESIQGRLREDLRKVGIIIGKIRTKMAILYERSGDFERAMACCREATEVYKHQPVLKEETKRDQAAVLCWSRSSSFAGRSQRPQIYLRRRKSINRWTKRRAH